MIKVHSEYADIWLIRENYEEITYCYGGTRSVPATCSDETAKEILNYLGKYESGIKNKLINSAIQDDVFEIFKGRIPEAFYSSNVGGRRCVFRPKTRILKESLIAFRMRNFY